MGRLPFEFNALELPNTLRCHVTWFSFLIQPVLSALHRNPPPERGVGRILGWHETVAEMDLEFKQLFKPFVPRNTIRLPFESNTLELSKALRCHVAWLSSLIQLAAAALIRNPPPELGVGRIIEWYETVTELGLEFAHFLKSYVPIGCQINLA